LGGIFYIKENIIMDSKFIEINGLKIHYVEKNEQERNLLFCIHGNSGSARAWLPQLNSLLLKSFRMIAFDLPGHGLSFSAEHAENYYSITGMANILAQAVSVLSNNQQFILVGLSLGTNLIAEMLIYPITPAGIFFISCTLLGEGYPLQKVFIPQDSPTITFYNELNRTRVEDFFNAHLPNARKEDIENMVEDYLAVIPEFKPTLFKTAAEGKVSDEIALLKQTNFPVAVIMGQQDQIVDIHYLDQRPFKLWGDTVFKLNNVGHWLNLEDATIVNEYISAYAHDAFKANPV
jgi:pimeloyl-ACP methyl ester carboxylesterase